MFFQLTVLAISLFLYCSIGWLKTQIRLLLFATNYPGYQFYPIIGNGLHILNADLFTAFQKMILTFGFPCNLWLGHTYYYVTASSEDVKIALNHPNSSNKMDIYKEFKLLFGRSLLMAPVNIWKKHRKLFTRSFNKSLLDSFVEIFDKNSQSILSDLEDTTDKDVFIIFERLSFTTFSETNLGTPNKCSNDIINWMTELQKLGSHRLTNHFIVPLWMYGCTKQGVHLLQIIFKLRKFVRKILEQNQKRLLEYPVSCDSREPLPVMDVVLKGSEVRLSREEMFGNLLFFTLGATDTSGLTLSYVFTLLGMNPDIQEQLYQEVIAVVGHNKSIELDDLNNLKYTERVIMETMRLFPAIPFIGRKVEGDINLGSTTIPKGANIFISLLNLHRNMKYWPDPLKFDPDRFLPEEITKRDPYCFIPFSAGPRNCIGKTYAMMMMKVTVANVIRRFTTYSSYNSVNDIKMYTCITIKTIDKLQCEFRLRTK